MANLLCKQTGSLVLQRFDNGNRSYKTVTSYIEANEAVWCSSVLNIDYGNWAGALDTAFFV